MSRHLEARLSRPVVALLIQRSGHPRSFQVRPAAKRNTGRPQGRIILQGARSLACVSQRSSVMWVKVSADSLVEQGSPPLYHRVVPGFGTELLGRMMLLAESFIEDVLVKRFGGLLAPPLTRWL